MNIFQLKYHRTTNYNLITLVLLFVYLIQINLSVTASKCEQKFEGFGVFLGSNDHFGRSKPGTDAKVLQTVYDSLGIRYLNICIYIYIIVDFL